jgi:uncharacterized protein
MGLSLQGRRALVTGASGGIGLALARALHGRGATVLASARRRDVLERLCDELGERAEALPADLSEREEVGALAERAGAVDVLVANAALPASGVLADLDPEKIDRALDVNLRAPIQLARALAPGMLERGSGHLVFMSSLSGKVASPGSALYCATKFGMRGFANGLAGDLAGSGVGVTTVFPGFIRDAGMFHESGAELPPLVGTSTSEEVAEATASAIERGRLEVDVAPLQLRVGAMLAGVAPAAVGALQRRFGAREVAEQIARGQQGKR